MKPNYTKISIVLLGIFYIALAMFFLYGCSRATISDETKIIDGCEYIVTRNSYGNGLTHKGNCKNPIHQCK